MMLLAGLMVFNGVELKAFRQIARYTMIKKQVLLYRFQKTEKLLCTVTLAGKKELETLYQLLV